MQRSARCATACMDWSTSVAISVKANIALHLSREMPASWSSTLNSQMMGKLRKAFHLSLRSSSAHTREDLQEKKTSRHFCLAKAKMKNETNNRKQRNLQCYDLLCGAVLTLEKLGKQKDFEMRDRHNAWNPGFSPPSQVKHHDRYATRGILCSCLCSLIYGYRERQREETTLSIRAISMVEECTI
jgi:hypothetical protein